MRGTQNTPEHFALAERVILNELIEHGRQVARPYAGSWMAPWLLSDVHSPVWLLRTTGSRRIDGHWKDVLRIRWDLPLPDGSLLSDERNEGMCKCVQQAAFLIRHLPIYRCASAESHAIVITKFHTVTEWLFYHADLYNPRYAHFSGLNTSAIEDFIQGYAKGGRFTLFHHGERVLRFLVQQAELPVSALESVGPTFQLAPAHRNQVIEWLKYADFYGGSEAGLGPHVRRDKLRIAAGISGWKISCARMTALLRQFEPELEQRFGNILAQGRGRTEHISHRVPTVDEIQTRHSTRRSCQDYVSFFGQLSRLKIHLPASMPCDADLQFRNARALAVNNTWDGAHTPWIPLDTAMAYTREALRWTSQYLPSALQLYLDGLRDFRQRGILNTQGESDLIRRYKRDARDDWVRRNTPTALAPIGLAGWDTHFVPYRPPNVYALFRRNPSLSDAVQVALGSVFVLIPLLKPLRESELEALRNNCISFKKGDGYWLTHLQRKARGSDHFVEITRPIPSAAARALEEVRRFSDALKSFCDEHDDYARMMLFYVPHFDDNSPLGAAPITRTRLQVAIDRFCDYVALPTDAQGRRWYLRVHEARKMFLITFFWSFKFGGLDADRWMAGHSSPEQTYQYLQANFPGKELSQLEAQYASQQLWAFESSHEKGETENIRDLHADVCKQFGVGSINAIRRDRLEAWLERAFATGQYDIQPFIIERHDTSARMAVAFKIKETARAQTT